MYMGLAAGGNGNIQWDWKGTRNKTWLNLGREWEGNVTNGTVWEYLDSSVYSVNFCM